MTKKMVYRNKTTVDFEYKMINEVIEELLRLKEEYGDSASFVNDSYPCSEIEYLFVRVLEEETDEEYTERVKGETEWEARKLESERILYEELKKKFGEK